MSELQKLTTSELKAELTRRTNELQALEVVRREKADQLVIDHVDALLVFIPQHSRTTCNDKNLQSDTSRCKRCFLLYAKEHGYVDGDWEVQIDLQRRPAVESLKV